MRNRRDAAEKEGVEVGPRLGVVVLLIAEELGMAENKFGTLGRWSRPNLITEACAYINGEPQYINVSICMAFLT